MMAFLNRPRAALPDTATLIEAVQQARHDLIATGKLDAVTARPIYEDMTDRIGGGLAAGEGRAWLDAPTGKVEDAIAKRSAGTGIGQIRRFAQSVKVRMMETVQINKEASCNSVSCV